MGCTNGTPAGAASPRQEKRAPPAAAATTLGSPCKWGLCVAEASDQLRGWEPFRAPTAPADADETVSVMSVTSGPTQLFDLKTKSALVVA